MVLMTTTLPPEAPPPRHRPRGSRMWIQGAWPGRRQGTEAQKIVSLWTGAEKIAEKNFSFQNREFLCARFYPSNIGWKNSDVSHQSLGLGSLLMSKYESFHCFEVFFTRNLKRTRCHVEGCSLYTNWAFKTTSMVFGLKPCFFETGWQRTMFYWLKGGIKKSFFYF